MSDLAIRVESVSKEYRIGARVSKYNTLRDTLTQATMWPLRRAQSLLRNDGVHRSATEKFWALRNVSFEVKRGEVIGIIGRNGAGKSTLLKILSRITEPTEGCIRIRGRVGSLLEVGTGFHPELTGRENIYLNAAILGMKRTEISRRFDEIVSFAEVEKFIDTPVKHFSSGMYLRLAFSVAAHLEPEILIVDEVLAVGDQAFQKKCLGKMGEVAQEGRTVLFVSHNMAAIHSLTSKCVLLEAGELTRFGITEHVVQQYLQDQNIVESACVDLSDWTARVGSGIAKILRLEILNDMGQATSQIAFSQPVCFRLTCDFNEEIEASFGVLIHSVSQEPLLDLRSQNDNFLSGRLSGQKVVECNTDALNLYPGNYLLSPWIMDRMGKVDVDFVNYCAKLTITTSASKLHLVLDPIWGRFVTDSTWKIIS